MSLQYRPCPQFLTQQGCKHQGCKFRHDIFRCECQRIILIASKREHLTGKPHRNAITALAAAARKAGTAGRTNGETTGFSAPQETPSRANNNAQPPRTSSKTSIPARSFKECTTCNCQISPQYWEQHQDRHTRFAELSQAKNDRNGIVVSHQEGIDFGLVEMGGGRAETVSIR